MGNGESSSADCGGGGGDHSAFDTYIEPATHNLVTASEAAADCSGSSPDHLFHYTNQSSCEAIQESGHIKMSSESKGDAVYGDGTYLTSLGPAGGTDAILKNNWAVPGLYDPDVRTRTECCIVVPKSSIPEVEQVPHESRDIWLIPDGNLQLAGKAAGYIAGKDVTVVERDVSILGK